VNERKSKGSPLYPKHRLETLEPYYCQHISAMTSEGLHDKSDIAEQLAWRDMHIAQLVKVLAEGVNIVEAACEGDESAWLAEAREVLTPGEA
jgi:hypothetical protein